MWTKELVQILIIRYKENEHLYNARNPDYTNRDRRSKSLFNICQELNKINKYITAEDIKKKIHTLRAQYIRENHEITKNKSAGVERIYEPKVWWYPQLEFLKPHCTVRKSESKKVFETDESSSGFLIKDEPGVIHNESKAQPTSCKRIIDSLKLNGICRICLEHTVIINWNEEMFELCGVTYKDCYYKYTELSEENASDEFPTNVCEKCADGLKNSYLLFKKALDSFEILEDAFQAKDVPDTKLFVSEPEEIQMQIPESVDYIYDEISKIDIAYDDKNLIKEEIFLTNMCENNLSVAETENASNNSNELTRSEDDALQPGHFIDIQNFESDDSLLIQDCSESFDTKKRKWSEFKKAVKKRRKLDSSTEKKDSDAGKTAVRKCELSSSEIVIEQKYDDSCDVDTSIPPITKKAGKRRKRNLLMCAYCSVKVNGTTRLRNHESTHNEDRKRTEICPKCGIKLYTKCSLASHMKTHDGNRKKIKCEFCEKAFFCRGTLNIHRRIHLGMMIKCQLCSKEYCRQIDLDRHLLTHSATASDKNVEQKKYTVQCQYCNKQIRTAYWREHKAAHLNEPQVKCTICDKEFFVKHACVQHIQRVHGKKTGYKEFIHYYVNWNRRMSHLMMTQTEIIELKS